MKQYTTIPILALVLLLQGCSTEQYDPKIDPREFSTVINNPYFTVTPGQKMIYEAQTKDGTERIEILILSEIKEIMGVETLVFWDRVWINDELVEETRDYLAQDAEGNVWYFGEDVDNYENGVLKDHDGAWIAGVDGAKPGMWMEADPKVGDVYRQEYYEGEAEDMAKVLSVSETVSVRGRQYAGCLKTYDYSPVEPTLKENKYYCKEVGGLVLEEKPADNERTELVSVEN